VYHLATTITDFIFDEKKLENAATTKLKKQTLMLLHSKME